VAWQSRSILPVWGLAVVGAVLVAALAGTAYLVWLPVVLAASVLLTFVVQLALQRKEGLVSRMLASIGGAFVLLLATGLVLALVHPVNIFA